MTEQIVVLASGFNTPRIKKRISQLKNTYSVKLIYLTRPSDNIKLIDSTLNIVDESKKIGVIENKKYLKRVGIYFKLLTYLLKSKNKKTYIFGSDFQIFILFLKGKKYLEIGDLRVIDLKGFSKIFLTLVDKITLKKIEKLILTSEHHFQIYYKDFITSNKVIIVRNKLEKNDCLINVNRKTVTIKDKITLGLFGMLRYEKPIDLLIDFIIKNNDNYNLIIYGITVGKYNNLYLEKLSNDYKNILWNGSYLYPDDLEKIYNEIDLNFVVYDTHFQNVKNAIPNKLYESSLFNRPILAANGTLFGDEVEKLNIGKKISIKNYKEFEDSIFKISNEEINHWSKNMNNIGFDEIFENDQYLKNI